EAAHAPIQSYNGTACTLLPAVTDRSTQWVVIVEHDNQTLPAIRRLFPNSQIVWRIDSPVGLYARALEVPAGQSAQLPVQNQVSADFGGDIQLIGYSELDKVKPGQTLDLTLAFRDVEPLDRLYKFFIHAAGADGSILAQDDRYPCDYTLNQADWRPGNILLQNFEVAIPTDAAAGSYAIKLGVYDPNSGSRLLVGQSALDHDLDQVNLGTVVVK
ncbi:MAG TPA: hypothetical protein VFK30_11145, partial [Anaerolineae bacterium]|nr:hypothetical protein [Anaerolineae bacterium]